MTVEQGVLTFLVVFVFVFIALAAREVIQRWSGRDPVIIIARPFFPSSSPSPSPAP